MLKHGFIFTLDALMATILAMLLLGNIFFFLSKSSVTFNEPDIHAMALDSLAILELDGTLSEAAATSDLSTVSMYLDALPDPLCGVISVYDAAQKSIGSSTKTGCSSANSSVTVSRVFILEYDPYYAQMEMWYG